MSELYRHSNKFTPQGLLAGIVAGVAAAIPLGFLYVYGIWSIPEAKLRGLCPVGYGAAIGAACGLALVRGKVRNAKWAGIASGAACLFALYFSWAVWILHLMFPSYWILNPTWLVFQPQKMWKIILSVNAQGTWAMTGSQPMTGTGLWLVWACEAALLIGFGVLVGVALVKRQPFCENCQSWCSERMRLYFAPVMAPMEIKKRVEAVDAGWLGKLARGNKKLAFYALDLHTCGNCHALNTLSLVQNLPRDKKTLVDKLLLSAEQATAVRSLHMNPETQASAPVAAVNPINK